MRRLGGTTALLVMMTSLLGVTLLGTQPAMADTTVNSVFPTDDTFANRDWCDFKVQVHIVGVFRGTDFFDNSGSKYKTILTAGGGGRYTWYVTAHGTTLTMQMQSFMDVIYYNPDGSFNRQSIHGLDLKFTVPGSGIVLQAVGTVSTDENGDITFEAGPNDELSGDFTEFCAALS